RTSRCGKRRTARRRMARAHTPGCAGSRSRPTSSPPATYPGDMHTMDEPTLTHRGQVAMGAKLGGKVAGPDGEARAQEIWGAGGPRGFDPSDPIWRVHDDASMFIGGITALLVQMLHPGAMAGVGDVSGYKDD